MPQVKLTTDYLWRGELYLAGDRMVPEELAIALGVGAPTEPEADEPTVIELEDSPVGEPDPVLFLLNSGDAEKIASLPTIGEKSAIKIAKQMPVGGYTSVDQCEEINADLTWIDWVQVKAMQIPEVL